MSNVLFFRRYGRKEYLAKLLEALSGNQDAIADLRAAKPIEQLIRALGVDDIALLALVLREAKEQQRARRRAISGNDRPLESRQSASRREYPTDLERLTEKVCREVDESARKTELLQLMVPQWRAISESHWAIPMLVVGDRIEHAFGTEEPFSAVSSLLDRTLPPLSLRQPYHAEGLEVALARVLRAAVSLHRENPAVQIIAPAIVATLGESPISESNAQSLSIYIKGSLNKRRHLDASVALSIEHINQYLHDSSDMQESPGNYRDARRLIWDSYLDLGKYLNDRAGDISRSGVWHHDQYLALSSVHEEVDLLPSMKGFLEFEIFGEYPSEAHQRDIVDAFVSYQGNSRYRGTSLIGSELIVQGHVDEPKADFQRLLGALGELFSVGSLDFDADWKAVDDLCRSLENDGLNHIADAVVAGWSFLWIFGAYRFLPIKALKALRFHSDEAAAGYSAKLLKYIAAVSRSEKLYGHLAQISWIHPVPTASEDVAPDAEIRLRELLSDELWLALDQREQEDLLAAEALFAARRQDPSAPERGFFVHVGCVFESLLQRALEPLLNQVAERLPQLPEDHLSTEADKHIAKVANKGTERSLGALHNLIQQRKRKLRRFPDLLVKLNDSALVSGVYSRRDYVDAIGAISSRYRNKASHAGPTRLSSGDIYAVRRMMLNNNLLREVIRASVVQIRS